MSRKWWENKVVYQIYPKSFQDTNGDGIGDLPGIISHLDYLKELGADILWICPCFRSPFVDQGYDISDYDEIDPLFGTNDDMKKLLEEAKKRNISIILDLVVNHCSSEHRWFKKACEDPDGEYGKFFYIVDKPADGKLPTNWRSYFGGSVWSELPGNPDKLYLHVFHEKQPDLNWENPEVRKEIYAMINRWLDMGVAGFRIDAIRNIRKPEVLHDYPADQPDGSAHVTQMFTEQQDIGVYLHEMRKECFDPHDAFTVAEASGDVASMIPDYVGEKGYFSSIFDFREIELSFRSEGWFNNEKITPEEFKQAVFAAQKDFAPYGFPTNVLENHDGPRGANRFLPENAVDYAGKTMLSALSFFLKGVPCIYQGQELGMENPVFTDPSQFDDVSSAFEYNLGLERGLSPEEALKKTADLTRDNTRVPMIWDREAGDAAGFCEGKAWIGSADLVTPGARQQEKDPHSVLAFYKEMIGLRKSAEYESTFVDGELIPQWTEVENLMAYKRCGDKQVLVAGNFNDQPVTVSMDADCKKVLLNNMEELQVDGDRLTLAARQLVVLAI